ncbi:O-antigen ligase family protein [Clostridium disporicum]|uniref:Lipid A core-O-antigen ligase and related enzymes n=1 Tax=Clostridium disporicum TaxID=84024 RepID=A0A174EXT0_9CLOT|nr:O-antigen ligase family protein [Clostridium disporicum]CUO42271.1 Lipid A core-O-antigen ligase and related enzymes [Clostridium disporicum]
MKILTKDSNSIIDNPRIAKLLIVLFLSSLFLIPFDDLPYITFLGGLGKRAAFYPFFAIIPIIAYISLIKRRIYISLTLEKYILIIFYIWICISTVVNFNNIMSSSYKGTSGISKSLIQIITLTFVITSSYCIELIISTKKVSLYTIRKFISLSLIPVTFVSLLEIFNMINLYDLSHILEIITYTINTALRGFVYGGRSRGVSAEASYLGMYCAFIFPWIISYLYTEKTKFKKVFFSFISLLILLIVIATKSRTATILILFELVSLFGLVLLFYSNIRIKFITTLIIILFSLCLFTFPKLLGSIKTSLSNRDNPIITENSQNIASSEYDVGSIVSSVTDSNNLSNIARSTMQNAAFKIGIDNPIFGVGLGQFAFNFSPYIQEDSLRSNEVKIWLDNSISTWPPVHSLYHRLFAESGLVGLLLYVSFVFIVCLKLLIKLIKSKKDILGMLLLISYSSIVIGSLTVDTLLIGQFWIMTPILILYTSDKLMIK